MIVHAKVAKLNRYLGEHHFDRVMTHIGAAHEEGLESYELEVDKLEADPKFDLLEALETMGYSVHFDANTQIFQVSIE